MSFMDIKEEEIEVVRGNMPYKEREGGVARHSLRYILGDLGDIKQKYFILGFHLNEFVQYEYYKDFGYESMKEFCIANIPLDYSAVSRCMSVHKYTCERLDTRAYPFNITNRMKDKYKNYGYSQLVEMVGMNEDQEKQCTPTMTIKEIRELKKQTKKNNNHDDSKENSREEKTDNCDVAINESKKDSCDVATTENQEKTKILIGEAERKMFYKTFVKHPADVVLGMFNRRFGDDLQAEARGKMLEMKIPGYEVTIRISFKEIEEE